MTLIDSLLQILREEIEAVFLKEKENKNYMKQTILGCRWRAFWGVLVMLKNAFPRMQKVLAYAIAKHRVEKHNDNKTGTMRSLSRAMSEDDKELSINASSWWENP